MSSPDQEREELRRGVKDPDQDVLEKFFTDSEKLAKHYKPMMFTSHNEPVMPKGFFDPSTGETTRIVDRGIQEYFTNGVVYLYRGREKKHIRLTEKVFEVFDSRMELEHPEECYTAGYNQIDGIWCFIIRKV